MEGLLVAREQWLNAFLAADVPQLKQIEADDFIAISEMGIETRDIRYAAIVARREAGRWFKPSAEIQDIDVRVMARGDLYQLVGRSQVIAKGNVIRDLYINELWGNRGGCWQVLSLHLCEASTIDATSEVTL